MVWVTWRREATSRLNWPPICVVTGQPATTGATYVFQKPWMRWMPRAFRIVAYVASPPVRVRLPASAWAARRVRTGRIFLLVGAVLIALALIAALVLAMQATLPWALLGFGALLVLGVAVVIAGEVAINVFGAGASVERLWIGKAHERFADAFVRANGGAVEVAVDRGAGSREAGSEAPIWRTE